ncbi:alpha/beta fold hydrolase [Candidatus Woesearchaeota archaeon]|nr:alpha/beta fold hydrolase [Candidatus Woesearchaeota archaeon]
MRRHKHPKFKRIVLYISILVLLLLFIVIVQLDFVFLKSSDVSLSVDNPVIYTKNSGNFTANYTIKYIDFWGCKTVCNYSIIDLGNMEVLRNSSFEINSNLNYDYSQPFQLDKKGFGRYLLYMEMDCTPIPRYYCKTDVFYRSNIISVHYNMTDKEWDVINLYGPYMKDMVNTFNDISARLLHLSSMQEALVPSLEKHLIGKELENVKNDFKMIDVSTSVNMWNDKEFENLADPLNYTQKLNAIGIALYEINAKINLTQHITNKSIALLEQINQIKPNLSVALGFYIKHLNDNNILLLSAMNAAAKGYDLSLDANQSVTEYLTRINETFDRLSNSTIEFNKLMSEGDRAYSEGILALGLKKNHSWAVKSFSCDVLLNLSRDTTVSNMNSEALRTDTNESEIEDAEDLFRIALSYVKNGSEIAGVYNDSFSLVILDDVSLIYDLLCKTKNYSSIFNYSSILNLISANDSIDIPDEQEPVLHDKLIIDDLYEECCTFGNCSNCKIIDSNYPVLFIHGHAFDQDSSPGNSLNGFSHIQNLMFTKGFINGAELDLNLDTESIDYGEYGVYNFPITYRATYYYIVDSYSFTAQKSERIENYAIRLKEIIDRIKRLTGKSKVRIVAHSMGGLVVREYGGLFGYQSIDKVITINTPHNGISGSVADFCGIFGGDKECEDMKNDSIFMSRLNSRKDYRNSDYYVLRTTGCIMGDNITGDGVVTDSSSYLDHAQNYMFSVNCTDKLPGEVHNEVLDPIKHPEVTEKILSILNSR